MSQRMIDRLMTEGAQELDRPSNTFHPWSIDALRDGTDERQGQRLFDNAEVLVVDNVTRYLYEACEQEVWSGEDYPNCAPPFPVFWLETRAPRFSRSGKTIVPWSGQHAWGCLCVANEIPEDLSGMFDDPRVQQRLANERQQAWESVQRTFALEGRQIPPTPPPSPEVWHAWFATLSPNCQEVLKTYAYTLQASSPDTLGAGVTSPARWHYSLTLFLHMEPHEPVLGPVLFGTALVSPTGQLVELPTLEGTTTFVQFGMRHGEYMTPEERQQLANLGNTMLMPFWLSLAFLHCKNVTLQKQDPCHQRKPPKSREVCRRLHYHVLDIKPMQEVLRQQGQREKVGLKASLHICRGHFADYRMGEGLFGKHRGLYWWDSHLRGRSARGIVVKDYALHTPAAREETL
jgi:hypothetical protein